MSAAVTAVAAAGTGLGVVGRTAFGIKGRIAFDPGDDMLFAVDDHVLLGLDEVAFGGSGLVALTVKGRNGHDAVTFFGFGACGEDIRLLIVTGQSCAGFGVVLIF